MALIDLSTTLFACWTLAYQAIFITSLPGVYAYWLFLLLAVPALLLLKKTRPWDIPAWIDKDGDGRLVCVCVIAISVAVAYLSMVVARPEWDDLGFFHRAAAQYRHIDLPFFHTDTAHNIPGMAPVSALQLLTSFEMASAFMARLISMDPVVFYHNISPAAASFLVPFVYYLLYRALGLDRWKAFAAMAAAVAFLWFDGNERLSFGNTAFVRMFQGKSVFVTLFVPIIFLYILRFARDPGGVSWLMLFLACAGSVGLTSSAFFMAPVLLFAFSAALLADRLTGQGGGRRAAARVFIRMNLTGGYLLLILVLMKESLPVYLNLPLEDRSWWEAVQSVLGGGWSLAWYGVILFALPWAALDRSRARLLTLYTAALILTCFNPVTGPVLWVVLKVYSRLVYVLPLPLCAGLSGAMLVEMYRQGTAWAPRTSYFALAALVLTGIPAYNKMTLSSSNYGVYFKRPMDYKFERYTLKFSKAVSSQLDGRNLLAPNEIVEVAALLNDTVRLETSRTFYTTMLFQKAGIPQEGERRMLSQLFVSGGPSMPGEEAAFAGSIKNGVDAVVARNGRVPAVMDELRKLPGVWKPAYQDENFTLLLKG